MKVDDIYLGNPNLKKANVPIDFTQEQLLEYVACREDPVYFSRQHVKIVSLDEGLIKTLKWYRNYYKNK